MDLPKLNQSDFPNWISYYFNYQKTLSEAYYIPLLKQIGIDISSETKVLDVGCGDGVHAAALEQAGGDLQYCGIDFSTQALEIGRQRVSRDGRFRFTAADATALPFASYSMDVVFSYGVLAYTRSPEAAFAEMVRVCRPGGLVGLWMFPQLSGWRGRVFNMTRSACRFAGAWGAWLIVRFIVLLLPLLPLHSGVSLRNASWRQCVEVLEVSLLPRTLCFFTDGEVRQWFKRYNVGVEGTVEGRTPVTIWGRVRSADS